MNGQVIPLRPRTTTEPYLSRRQLADILGMSERWIDYRRAEGMPSRQFGNRRKFLLSEVRPWITDWQKARDAA